MDDNDLIFDINFFLDLNYNPLFHKNKIITWYRLYTSFFILITSINNEIKIKLNKNAKKHLWKQYIESRNNKKGKT